MSPLYNCSAVVRNLNPGGLKLIYFLSAKECKPHATSDQFLSPSPPVIKSNFSLPTPAQHPTKRIPKKFQKEFQKEFQK